MSISGRTSVSYIALLLAVIASSVSASSTGLVQIPTAEVIRMGQFAVSLATDGAFRILSPGDASSLGTEFGVLPRCEAGIDLAFHSDSPKRAIWDVKYLLSPGLEHKLAFGVGLASLDASLDVSPYAVIGSDMGWLRGHGGFFTVEGCMRWFAGVDRDISDRIAISADYISGDVNASSVGISYDAGSRYSLEIGALFPNAGGDTTFSVLVAFGGRMGRHSESESRQ